MGRIAIRLKSSYEVAEPRRQNDQITRFRSCDVSVRFARGNKDGRSWASHLRSVVISEMQLSFRHMPRFVVRAMDMENWRSTAAPFVETKRPAGCGEGC